MVGLAVADVVGGVDGEVGGVDDEALERGLEELGVVHGAVLLEEELLVLSGATGTLVLTPKNLNSSTSTSRS